MTVMRMKDHSDYMKQLSMVHGAGREFARFMMAVNILFLLSACPNLVSGLSACLPFVLAGKGEATWVDMGSFFVFLSPPSPFLVIFFFLFI